MSNEQPEAGHNGRREPYRVRLPGFIGGETIGLGDVVKRATSIVGIKPCGGCDQRASQLLSLIHI